MKLGRSPRTEQRLSTRIHQPLAAPAELHQIWALDFMSDALYGGRAFRRLNFLRLQSILVWVLLLAAAHHGYGASEPQRTLIERAKSLELSTPYVPPPGDALEHEASGYAKILCSSVFVTGLDPRFVAENVGYFTAPYEERAKLRITKIDRAKQIVEVSLPNGTVRQAVRVGSQGCVTLPIGRSQVFFTPSAVKSTLPNPNTQPWPMGDILPSDGMPAEIDQQAIERALKTADDPAGMTAALLITYKGRIVAEHYGEHITYLTPLEGWSMGKSIVASLLGVLIREHAYSLSQPAPIPQWQAPGDPRAKITVADIMHMSSGLRIRSPADPDFDERGPYPDHLYLYTGSIDSFNYAATRPLEWPPNTVGRYRNTDPVLASYLIRLAVEKRHEDYHAFPQRELFDRIGIRTMVLDVDPYGNFLTQGYEQGSARDWARLANLYLQGGVWNGERILTNEFVRFVRTPAPAWEADGRPIYGGFFWLNEDLRFPVPKDSFLMAGAGGQFVFIIPSRQLVIVRLGHYKGVAAGTAALRNALPMIVNAVPPAS